MPGRLVRIPVWWLIVGIMTCIITPCLSIWTSVAIANKNAEELLHQQQVSEQRARQESIRLTCGTFAAMLDVYKETPPSTPAGHGAQKAYLEQYKALGCKPSRTE